MDGGEEERDPMIDSPDMELMASLTMEPKMGKGHWDLIAGQ